jgi:2-dehydropantoate 2-reductase
VYGITVLDPSGLSTFRDGFGYEMKDDRMRRAVPYIPHILDQHRRNEYVPSIAADRIRPLPEEATQPPVLEGSLDRKDSIIKILIVAKKASETIRAIQDVRHRLKRSSTIVLLHNGMGVLSQVQSIWPEKFRPNILEGFSTHGLSKRADFTLDHWGQGKIHMAIAPRLDEQDIFTYQSLSTELPPVLNSRHVSSDLRLQILTKSQKYNSLLFIIQQLLRDKSLNCTLRAYIPDLYLIQLRRTLLQSIIQLLGSLQRATNAEIVTNKKNHRIIGKLLSEIIPVLHLDPLIQSSPKYLEHFSFRELYGQIHSMAMSTPNHMNTQFQDIIGKRETEIAYHSGYFITLARERGLKVPFWRTMHELVIAGKMLEHKRYEGYNPVGVDGEMNDLPEWMEEQGNWERNSFDGYEVTEPYAFEELEIPEFDAVDTGEEWEKELNMAKVQSEKESKMEEKENTPKVTEKDDKDKEKVEVAVEAVAQESVKNVPSTPAPDTESSVVARLQAATEITHAGRETEERERKLIPISDRSFRAKASQKSLHESSMANGKPVRITSKGRREAGSSRKVKVERSAEMNTENRA